MQHIIKKRMCQKYFLMRKKGKKYRGKKYGSSGKSVGKFRFACEKGTTVNIKITLTLAYGTLGTFLNSLTYSPFF